MRPTTTKTQNLLTSLSAGCGNKKERRRKYLLFVGAHARTPKKSSQEMHLVFCGLMQEA
jgi:hypothetical protein